MRDEGVQSAAPIVFLDSLQLFRNPGIFTATWALGYFPALIIVGCAEPPRDRHLSLGDDAFLRKLPRDSTVTRPVRPICVRLL